MIGESNKSKLKFYNNQVIRMSKTINLPYYDNKPIAYSYMYKKLECFIELKEKYEKLVLKEKIEKKLPEKGIKIKGVKI